ncbi:dimethylaniline monooxygenase [N-oxide-forming] [Elysia marginata]|uniref:Flavin-containing monooxygenase n=1 Tax=Elysia marginata TaxID=1093978 RepID=A0AAV4JUJ4_9GAST|nr:dimethylaniline monooxygenase [N-oxide-forming] [Elysia marginata]
MRHSLFNFLYGRGGIWTSDRSGETSNSPWAWDNLITNTTKYMMTFSDYPYYPDTPEYMTRDALGKYYRSYAEHFGLTGHIQYDTRVLKVRKTPDHSSTGQWEVFTCPTSQFHGGDKRCGLAVSEEDLNRCHKEVFDVVLVCSGNFKRPLYPEIPGLHSFPGVVKHSFDYKSGVPYKDKKVLVVGNSFSAGDIATDISLYTEEPVDLSIGKGTWINPRVQHGCLSADRSFSRHLLYGQSEEKVNNFLIARCQKHFDHIGARINPELPPSKSPYMMGDDIYLKILTDQIRFQDRLVRFNGSTAEYKNGVKTSDIDAVVFATGYAVNASFVDLDIVFENGRMELYNRMLPLGEKHCTCIFIGFLGGDGPVGPAVELQARYAARLITGKLQPPSRETMEKNIQAIDSIALRSRGKYSYHLPLFVMGDLVAQDLGVYPSFWRVFVRDPVLAYRIWYGPIFSAQYRLLGPDSDWDKAREMLYRAHQVRIINPCSRAMVKVRRDDITAARKRQLLWVACSVTVVVALGYFGRSKYWPEALNFRFFRTA